LGDWDPEIIKAAIRRTGVTLADLARREALAPQVLRHTLARPRAEGERVIARFLDVPPHVIWPSRYHEDGKRRSPQPRENYSPEARFGKAS